MSETNTQNITEETGNISVHTENLFPIIKKWLYSEPDIFLRELISNAYDAIRKLEHLIDTGSSPVELNEPLINVQIDKPGKTLTISDNGLGMTANEIKKYINQIAFSGAEEFVKKYQLDEKNAGIIGHFGMGFFSSFMVSDKVEIDTLSHQEGGQAVKWSCEGQTSFKITSSTRSQVGTDIILHIASDNENYLDEGLIKDLVKRYSDFIPVKIQVNGKEANQQFAIWQKKAQSLKKKDYDDFYQKLFPGEQEPLFHIHLDVDYPFKLKGVLYFPKIRNDLEINQKGRIKLFCNNVFVSDNVAEFIPNYLTLLQGVIDSPDIPLNVSRSTLQHDQNVKKISSHIVKKITDHLKDTFKEDRPTFEKHWKDIHPFIKFGIMSDNDFYDKIKDHIVFETVDREFLTLKGYQKKNTQLKDKIVYASDGEKQKLFINKIKSEGVDVILLDSPIDNHFLQHYEMKVMPVRFVRVDSSTPEEILSDDKEKSNDKEKKESPYKDKIDWVKKQIGNEAVQVEFSSLKEEEIPSILVYNEHMRRFQDMSTMFNRGENKNDDLAFATLVLNLNNPLVKKIIGDGKEEERSLICEHLYDLALLQQGKLTGEKLIEFTKRNSRLISAASSVLSASMPKEEKGSSKKTPNTEMKNKVKEKDNPKSQQVEKKEKPNKTKQ